VPHRRSTAPLRATRLPAAPRTYRPLGTVYLLHFARPLPSRRHYVGWTENLPRRIRQHATGTGAAETRRFAQACIPFAIARLWSNGTTELEQQITREGAALHCPICEQQRNLQLEWDRGQAELEAVGLLLESHRLR
jgi:predicted GIY-YIG superfamily endonuclease